MLQAETDVQSKEILAKETTMLEQYIQRLSGEGNGLAELDARLLHLLERLEGVRPQDENAGLAVVEPEEVLGRLSSAIDRCQKFRANITAHIEALERIA